MATIRLALLSLMSLPAFAGPPLGYAQATGYLKKDSQPSRYQPLNLLDGRDATAWCTPGSDPLNEHLTFGFNEPVALAELKFSTGNNFSEGTWAQFARAAKFSIRSGKDTRTFKLEDVRTPQTFAIEPPLKGLRFTVEVLESHAPDEDLDAPVCVTDLIFVADGKALNGPWLTTKLKYDKGVQYLMGTWFAGYEGTPDYFLTFNFDGSFRYSYEPYDTKRNKPVVIMGKYQVTGDKLRFDLDGARRTVSFKKADGKLVFDGELPEGLKGPWRAQP